jgi:hypothetical protein
VRGVELGFDLVDLGVSVGPEPRGHHWEQAVGFFGEILQLGGLLGHALDALLLGLCALFYRAYQLCVGFGHGHRRDAAACAHVELVPRAGRGLRAITHSRHKNLVAGAIGEGEQLHQRVPGAPSLAGPGLGGLLFGVDALEVDVVAGIASHIQLGAGDATVDGQQAAPKKRNQGQDGKKRRGSMPQDSCPTVYHEGPARTGRTQRLRDQREGAQWRAMTATS